MTHIKKHVLSSTISVWYEPLCQTLKVFDQPETVRKVWSSMLRMFDRSDKLKSV